MALCELMEFQYKSEGFDKMNMLLTPISISFAIQYDCILREARKIKVDAKPRVLVTFMQYVNIFCVFRVITRDLAHVSVRFFECIGAIKKLVGSVIK